MTRIHFYTQVGQPFELIVALAEQAMTKQHKVTVYVSSAEQAEALSATFWQKAGPCFIANALPTESEAPYTSIQLAWQTEQVQQEDILLNYQPEQILFFGQFKQVYEIISHDETETKAGRRRYVFYRDRGYAISHTDCTKIPITHIPLGDYP